MRRLALHTGEVSAPRLVARLVERVGFGAYLEDDGIDARLLQGVELGGEHALHALFVHTLELAVDALYPGSAEFALGGFRLGRCR